MEEVLEVYSRPYDKDYPVVCYDESPKQLVSEIRQSYIDSKGVKHEDCEYKREGAAEIVMIVEPLGQRREVFVEEDHTGYGVTVLTIKGGKVIKGEDFLKTSAGEDFKKLWGE